MKTEAQCIWPVASLLGEGPIWSEREQSVWFVDIKQQHIHCFNPASGQSQRWDAPAQPGFVVPLAGGGFITGLQTGLHYFHPHLNRFNPLTKVESHAPNNRLNDGYVDVHGRLWFGSMHDGECDVTGALYCFNAGAVQRVDEGYCITNGPTVSPDGHTLYHVDTLQRVIYAFDINHDGQLLNKRIFTRIERPGAFPDGLSIDAAGCVWVALWGGWGLERYSPQGELIGYFKLPCANVTKAAFGDADLRTVYITTARKGLSPSELAAQPLAGGLFAMRVTTPGVPQYEALLN